MHRLKEKTRSVRVINFARIHAQEESAKREGTAIVDLSGVGYLDLPGLVALLRFIADVRAAGGEVGLVGLSGKARLQAQQIQLHRLVEIFNTVEEVVRSVSQRRSG